MATVDKAWESVRRGLPQARPRVAFIFGSGWSAAGQAADVHGRMSYSEIPGLERPGVPGHDGELVLASWRGLSVMLFQGRRHWYEGEGWIPVVLPVLLAQRMGVSVLVLTNAAGGIRDDLAVGDLMVIDDHINFIPSNPLMGPAQDALGPRFPDQTEVYDATLRTVMKGAGEMIQQPLPSGVYLATAGPTYETPAEVAAFRGLGADAVGMSTAPEAMVANAIGLRVAGISCITNQAGGSVGGRLSHGEVMGAAGKVRETMQRLLDAFLAQLSRRDVLT